MRQNETLIHYTGVDQNSRYTVRLYESTVDFTRRDFFSHKHSDFEFSYIVSGNGLYALRDGACLIREGDVFLFGANQVHCITDRDPDSPMILFNLQFESRLIWSPLSNMLNERYLQFFNGKCERLDPFAESTSRITRIMKKIMKENQEKNVGYQLMIKAYLYQIIGELIRGCGVSFEDPADGVRQRGLLGMDRAMTYINEHLDTPLTLEEIASVAGFTRNYFSSLFTELNGLTTWDYITIRRIERSCELLSKTDLPIIEVAQRCGYENLSNFNRMFLRIVGASPSVYRRTHFLQES